MSYNFNVMVIGDYGLDIWREGTSHRLSPEAPVPVVLNPSLRESPGLAGNVAANLASLGAQVLCLGVVGEDEGRAFDAYIRAGLPGASSTLLRDRGRLPTIKERIISDGYQIVRVDEEQIHPIERHLQDKIINQADAAMRHSDGVVISDYGKGVCTERLVEGIMAAARDFNIPVFVDPKDDLLKYKGATILKPNEAEWEACLDVSLLDVEYVVVTRGAKGMQVRQKALYEWVFENFPGYEVPVHDRTGAGDTAMAVMALEYIHSKDIAKAVNLANIAGALAVQHSGTYRATVEDLEKFRREQWANEPSEIAADEEHCDETELT